jgi:ABC-type spermidine/putrescine transport system permease subunit I
MSKGRQSKKTIRYESDFRVIPGRTLVAILLPTIAILALFLVSYSSFITMSLHETVPGKAMVSDTWSFESYRKFFSEPIYFTFLFDTLYRSAQITLPA